MQLKIIVFIKCTNLFVVLFKHRDSPENNADTPFEFTEENKKVCWKLTLIVSLLIVFVIDDI